MVFLIEIGVLVNFSWPEQDMQLRNSLNWCYFTHFADRFLLSLDTAQS